jgi:hypothetical protein
VNALTNPLVAASAKGAAWLLVWSWQAVVLLACVWAGLKIERILDNLRLLWGSYDSLTERQQVEFDEFRLDQEHFFDHQLQQ